MSFSFTFYADTHLSHAPHALSCSPTFSKFYSNKDKMVQFIQDKMQRKYVKKPPSKPSFRKVQVKIKKRFRTKSRLVI